MPFNSSLSRHIPTLALGGAAMATVTLALAAGWPTQNANASPAAAVATILPAGSIADIVASGKPAVVTKAAAGSGIEQGDAILAVNQEKMSSASDVLKAVDSAVKAERKSILLQIERAGNQSFVAVPLGNA